MSNQFLPRIAISDPEDARALYWALQTFLSLTISDYLVDDTDWNRLDALATLAYEEMEPRGIRETAQLRERRLYRRLESKARREEGSSNE